ncbi:MAG: queuosine precursor transporter [Longimicrobiaceae bacterium]
MPPSPPTHAPRRYRYYDLIMAAFVTVLLCSNLIGAGKPAHVGAFTFSGGVLFFPISYLFGDILTEVYGYARARRVVWAGFAAMLFASLMSVVVLALPPASGWEGQAALRSVFGGTPRIVMASLVAFWAGELTNSFTLAKMKIWSEGRRLWTRTIGSTVVGEIVDSLIFYPLAFLGVWETATVVKVLFTNYALKVLWEVVATPLTYRVVAFLKRAEHEDWYDRDTDFTPFSLSVE